MNDDTYVSGIPGLVNPQTIERMNRLSVMHWKGPMEEFLSITYDMMLQVLMEQLDSVFLQYQQTALYGKLKVIILSFMDCIRQQHFQLAYENYEIECMKPFTMATTALQRAQREALDYITTRRHEARVKQFLEDAEALGFPNWTKKDATRITESDIGVDEFAREVEVMAVSVCSFPEAFIAFRVFRFAHPSPDGKGLLRNSQLQVRGCDLPECTHQTLF
jgi:hypothetical protein